MSWKIDYSEMEEDHERPTRGFVSYCVYFTDKK